ncbi:MAG TPA: metallophosphoesterase family protein [Mucilaginibacter sp.]|nr:metallophosphoesterase family protein [Mucilaginibacter sp.]
MKSIFKRFSNFIGICFLISPCIAFSQPRGIHINFSNDGGVISNAMTVTWFNDQSEHGTIKYGTSANKWDQTAQAVEVYSSTLKTYVNKISLQNLKSATVYYYAAGSDKNGWSAVHHFKTPPKPGSPIKIVVGLWSDTQNNGGNYNFEQTDTIVKQMGRYTYDFTIHTGDIVENGSVAKSWINYFNISESLNANYPLMSVTGNHDVVNDTASNNFQKPFPVFYEVINLPGQQLNYSYNYGNAHFVAINSGYAQGAEKVDKVLFREGSAEYKWLEADLKKAREDRHIKWIILYSHYPLFVFGVSHIQTWQNHIQPLVDKYKVDLCIAGHRHVYERHKAVRGTQVFEQNDANVYTKPTGTVYINNGSCGGSLQGTGGWDMPDMLFTPKQKIYTYGVLTIEANTINGKVYDKAGNEVDHFSLIK